MLFKRRFSVWSVIRPVKVGHIDIDHIFRIVEHKSVRTERIIVIPVIREKRLHQSKDEVVVKLCGIESCGMILSAVTGEGADEKLQVVTIEGMPAGAKIC